MPKYSLTTNHPLQLLNTFGIAAHARHYLPVTTVGDLTASLDDPRLEGLPRLVLGGGSNVLFTGDFDGVVLHMAIKGRAVLGCRDGHTLVRAAAGENWHEFVQWTLANGLGGLENLSLIPGTVGAAPIQNIGAYGVELKDVLDSVTVFEMATGQMFNMNAEACQLGYRDSVFKHAAGAGLVIVDVTFALPIAWRANLGYAELARELEAQGVTSPSAVDVGAAVVEIRRRKLPDPAVIGNAGSFFKNPVVSSEYCSELLRTNPGLIHHPQSDGSEKIAAGWMIDQCGWKGRNMGSAGVYPKQALVLVNNGGATGEEVLALARSIGDDVFKRYGVQLEAEPVFV